MNEKKKCVLVVEDHAGLLKIMTLELQLNGYEVAAARDGQEAIDIIVSKSPDIVILDLFIPIIDGFGVLERLRNIRRIPVIAVSAYTDLKEKALSSGASAFIAKPFDPDKLVTKIKEYLK